MSFADNLCSFIAIFESLPHYTSLSIRVHFAQAWTFEIVRKSLRVHQRTQDSEFVKRVNFFGSKQTLSKFFSLHTAVELSVGNPKKFLGCVVQCN